MGCDLSCEEEETEIVNRKEETRWVLGVPNPVKSFFSGQRHFFQNHLIFDSEVRYGVQTTYLINPTTLQPPINPYKRFLKLGRKGISVKKPDFLVLKPDFFAVGPTSWGTLGMC